MATARRRRSPATATSALVPAAARAPESLSQAEAALNEQAIDVFATAVGGRDQLAAVLSVAGTSPAVEQIALYLLDDRYREWSLRRLCHFTGITVADLFAAYKKAMIARAHIEATHLIARRSLAVVEDVMARAAPHKSVCPKCLGTSTAGQGPCLVCHSSGVVQTEPDLDRQKVALELAQLLEKKGITMQQNTIAAGALLSPAAGALEQLHQAVGDLLYSPSRRRAGAPPIEAESIDEPPADHRPRTEPRDPPWPLPTPDRDDPEAPGKEEPDADDTDAEAPAGVEPPYCYVSAADYARYWEGQAGQGHVTPPTRYAGTERRLADRRARGHERRWEASRGRRVRERRQRFTQPALPFLSM